MPWTVTLEIVDCTSTSTKLAGARIFDGSNVGFTDANGLLIYIADDSFVAVFVQISFTAATATAPNGYITKTYSITVQNAGTIQQVCLNPAPPSTPTGSCFTGDTQITLADGTEKPIALVRVGDLVLGRSGRPNRVTAIEQPRLGDRKLYALNAGVPFVTAEHPFMTEAGWKAIDPAATLAENPHLVVDRLAVADVMIRLKGCAAAAGSHGSGDSVKVILESIPLAHLDVHDAGPETQLYNLLLDGDHAYFADGFVVHNKNGGCFIVSATTGSSQSEEVNNLRALRDRVSGASRLGGQLIDVIYREYYQFSPNIAAELQQDGIARVLVLSAIVRPLLAWYSLAGTLALEQSNEQAVRQATGAVSSACPTYLGGASIVSLLEAIRAGEALPPNSHPLLLEFASRMQGAAPLPFAAWAILDPLIRVWRSATDHLDVVDEVAQWLATAPLEALAPPSDPELLELELGVLASFFDFRPAARRQLAARLSAAWPAEVGALNRAGFDSQVIDR